MTRTMTYAFPTETQLHRFISMCGEEGIIVTAFNDAKRYAVVVLGDDRSLFVADGLYEFACKGGDS